jgi:sortase A
MRPEDTQLQAGEARGRVQPPSRGLDPSQQAAANVARSQIDSIYDNPGGQSQAGTTSSFAHVHQTAHTIDKSQWEQYHSAWQNYYQKYYERYYMGAVEQVKRTQAVGPTPTQPIGSGKPPGDSATISEEEALHDLRGQLVDKVRKSGEKVRKSRHFVPLTAALVVLLIFGFLQYNRVIIANVKAYVTPGEIDPQNIVVDPNASLAVGKEPRLIIPKINVNVPVVYNTTPDQASQLKAMENGVAWFGIPGANSKPGQIGNTVLSGHSSNDFTDGGNYKFIFALLERLKEGDVFYLHYEGTRYTYTVTKTQVVKPTNVSSLVYETDKPVVTLITCTPLGTALNRLLVTAEQVSPSPSTAKAAPDASTGSSDTYIPGNSPTFFERLFGG